MFWVNVPIGIVALGVTWWAVSESRDPGTRSLDVPGTALITAGLGTLTWGLINTDTHSWLSTYTLAFLVASLVLIVLFVIWESRTPEPMIRSPSSACGRSRCRASW